jgi:hypothetical protein
MSGLELKIEIFQPALISLKTDREQYIMGVVGL